MNQPRQNYNQGGGGQNRGLQLPRSFFDPIEKYGPEEFGHWGCCYDWTSWNGPQAFMAKRNEIEAARAGGFRLIAHTALQLVIKPLVNNGRLIQMAYDDLEAICEDVADKIIAAKRAEDERKAKEKSEAEAKAAKGKVSDPTPDSAEVNKTVSAVLQGAIFRFIRDPLQAHWNEFVTDLKDDQRVALYKTLRQIPDEEREQVIKDLMQVEDRKERMKVATKRGLII